MVIEADRVRLRELKAEALELEQESAQDSIEIKELKARVLELETEINDLKRTNEKRRRETLRMFRDIIGDHI